jgi:hypothetical protein
MRWVRWIALTLGGLLAVLAGGRPASATSITLEADVDLQSVTPGSVFTILVGLDDLDEIQAYLLDVEWSGDRLALVDAAALACAETNPGVCEVVSFTVDPMQAATEDYTTRAAVLVPPPFTLFLDGRTTSPAPDPRPGLFALTFEALEGEGWVEITAGLLDAAASAVVGLDDLVPIDPLATTLSFEIVPEPDATLEIVAAALGLFILRRRGR